jgi:hypothetical protein
MVEVTGFHSGHPDFRLHPGQPDEEIAQGEQKLPLFGTFLVYFSKAELKIV